MCKSLSVKDLLVSRKEAKDNISRYVDDDLCAGCGTCYGICPKNAVRMRVVEGRYVPRIDNDRCTECGLCINVCPVLDWNRPMIDRGGREFFLGHFIKTYAGWSTNEAIRWTSASGGVVSTLLLFLLESGFIDGAVVVGTNPAKPLLPRVFIARTKKDVLSSSGSKYCPVPLNTIIRDLMLEEGKFAVVGLPCHIRGLRKAEENNKKLKGKIVLHIGIFCSHTLTFDGTDLLLAKLGIKKRFVEKLEYRGRGWPGNLYVTLCDSSTVKKPYFDYWFPLFAPHFFTPSGCMFCSDHTSESSDISCGDAWIPNILVRDREGASMIISRTELGEKILESAIEKGLLKLAEIDPKKVIQSQWGGLEFKKISLIARTTILKHLGKQLKVESAWKFNIAVHFAAALQIVNARLGRTKLLRSLLRRLPFVALKIYAYLVAGTEYLSWYLTTGLSKNE